jgi:hypothetical protein
MRVFVTFHPSRVITTNPAAFFPSATSPVRAAIFQSRRGCRTPNVRNFHPAKFRRPRVLRIFQRPVAERFVARTFVVAQNSGQQPRDRVNHHHRGQRAVRQHIIADGQLVVRQRFPHPLVKTFVMAGDEQQIFLPAPVRARWPGQTFFPTATAKSRASFRASNFPPLQRAVQRLQQHSRPAAKRPVVHGLVPVMRPVAQIVDFQIQQTGCRARA